MSFRIEQAVQLAVGKFVSKALAQLISGVGSIITFSDERRNRLARSYRIIKAYRAGTPVADIMDMQGCCKGTVLRYARFAGLPKRPKGFTQDKKEAVLADYILGMEVSKIAKKHGVSPAYISLHAGKAGVQRYGKRK